MVLIGHEAGKNLNPAYGAQVAIGYRALKEAADNGSTGNSVRNVAIGRDAAYYMYKVQGGVYIGDQVASGYVSSSTQISDQIMIGPTAGYYCKGGKSIGIGYNALERGNALVDAKNIGIGYNVADNMTSGVENIALGTEAGRAITSGQQNTILGTTAGSTLSTGDNCIIIGSNADSSSASVDNEITIGDTNITKFRVPGINFVVKDNGGTPSNGQVLTADNNGEAYWAAAGGGSSGLPASGGTFTGSVTFEDAINENVFTITDGASVDLDPDNGMIQQWTLGANRTATESLTSGQSMMLMVADGTAYTLTFPTMTWVGGSAPTLATSGYTVIELWKTATTLYGAKVGDVA